MSTKANSADCEICGRFITSLDSRPYICDVCWDTIYNDLESEWIDLDLDADFWANLLVPSDWERSNNR